MEALLKEIESTLAAAGTSDAALEAILDRLLTHFDCAAGTIHCFDPLAGTLELRAARGVPPAILPQVRRIPLGKGMAGLAAERREPVQVCNLQADASGVAKPGARATKMEGSIALPMLAGGELRGTLGVAKPVIYEFTPEETGLLLEAAALVGASFR